jgi:hypothetical protein
MNTGAVGLDVLGHEEARVGLRERPVLRLLGRRPRVALGALRLVFWMSEI